MTARLLTLPADQYHADQIGDTPTLSSSIAKLLLTRSPAHAYAAHPKLNPNWQRQDEPKFDVGNCVHALLLQGIEAAEIIDFPDWRTNAAKDARELARAHGRIPMLGHQWMEVEAMVAAVQEKLAALDIDPVPFTNGQPEQTITWDEEGVACRARLDWIHDDLSACDDFKSTSASANPDAWCRTTLWNIGADIQVAFHLRGVKAVTGTEPEWRFIVAETAPPYELSVVSLTPEARDLAERKVDHAISIWRRCLDTGVWDGYPRRIAYAEPPGWAEAQFMELELREVA